MYYIVYAVLYAFSLLPFWFIYMLSDAIAFFLYYVIRYRKDVIKENLQIAFPEKSEAEITKITKEFYRNFVDNFLEMAKMLSISKKEMQKRFFADTKALNSLYPTGQNTYIILGHLFNWEYANLSYAAGSDYPFVVAYKPISNKIFDRIVYKIRARFGTHLVSSTNFRKDFTPFAKDRYTLVLVGDQNPNDTQNAYWTNFFGKKTSFAKGPERGSKLNNAAIFMGNIYKTKRGFYTSELKLLTTDPRNTPDGYITKEFINFIEDTVRKYPSNYLWSHRRWKWEFNPELHASMVID